MLNLFQHLCINMSCCAVMPNSFQHPCAVSAMPKPIRHPRCGTGTQTLTLTRHLQGHIQAVDLFPQFVDILNCHARQEGLHDRIEGIVGDMADLPFAHGNLDIIWFYNIGFQRGLHEWRPFLRHDGFLAVSEAVWTTNQRPPEVYS